MSCLPCLRVFLTSSWSTTSWSIAAKSCRMLCKMKSRSGTSNDCWIYTVKVLGEGKCWNSDVLLTSFFFSSSQNCLPNTAACTEGELGMHGFRTLAYALLLCSVGKIKMCAVFLFESCTSFTWFQASSIYICLIRNSAVAGIPRRSRRPTSVSR